MDGEKPVFELEKRPTNLPKEIVQRSPVKELMGHGTLAMTERYSHLSPDKLRRAVKTLEAGMDKARASKKVVRLGEK